MQEYSAEERKAWTEKFALGSKVKLFAVILIAAATLPSLKLMEKSPFPFLPLAVLALFECALNIPYHFIAGRIKNFILWTYYYAAADIIILTIGLHYLGGYEAAFFNVAYLIIILWIGLFYSARASFAAAAFASVSYASLIALEYYRILPHISIVGMNLAGRHQLVLLVFNIFSFFIFAFLAVVSQKILGRTEELKNAKKELELWNKELAARVEERTKTLEANLEELKIISLEKERLAAESALLAEKEKSKAAALESAQDAYLNIMEDLGNKQMELEQTLNKLKTAQAELIQADKLSAIGQLSVGIAHEINNPLFVISGEAEMLAKNPNLEQGTRDSLSAILEQSKKIKAITGGLLDFSRREKSEKKAAVDINDTLNKALLIIDYQVKSEEIKISADLDPGLPRVTGDPGQLEEVFLNIMLNGIQAMKKGGELALITRREQESVVIKIKDNGTGMSNETKSRLFEPFFSTKEMGTGLGLSVSYGIIQNHGGKIEVESEEGKGTAFIISLPAAKAS